MKLNLTIGEMIRTQTHSLDKGDQLCWINILLETVSDLQSLYEREAFMLLWVYPCNMIIECESLGSLLSKCNTFSSTWAKVCKNDIGVCFLVADFC